MDEQQIIGLIVVAAFALFAGITIGYRCALNTNRGAPSRWTLAAAYRNRIQEDR